MNARNLITRWGPNAEISEYASREWSGLLSNYYKMRWQLFLNGSGSEIDAFEIKWQYETIHDLQLRKREKRKKNANDLREFYKTLKSIYYNYEEMIDCK